MASPTTPTRLVICVDGTWCSPDGPDRTKLGNITNVYRIFATVKEGSCFDKENNQQFNQRKLYYEGIGSADDIGSWERLRAGISGDGYKTQIREIYRECCLLNDNDEVWFYGFSRGAYIVRAVAGLLHYIGALNSVNFDGEYKNALKMLSTSTQRKTIGAGQVSTPRPKHSLDTC